MYIKVEIIIREGSKKLPVFPQLLVDSQRVLEIVLHAARSRHVRYLPSFFVNSFGDHTSRPSHPNFPLH